MFECSICQRSFSFRLSLRRHNRLVHQVELPFLRPEAFACGSCKKKFSSVEQFTQHLQDAHEVSATIERLKFDSKPEFENWKRSIESASPVKFIKIRTRKAKDKEVVYYHCNRSGPVKLRVSSNERKREIKTQGSCKINAYCPARITATCLNDGSVETSFCLTHFGHKLSAAHVPLPSSVKKTIATKIASNVPFDRILSDVRKNLSGELSRVHLLNNQDLRNLMRDFQLDCDYKILSDDSVSVEKWVELERNSQGSDSAVIIYKSKEVTSMDYPGLENDDFLLGVMTCEQMEMLNKFGENVICMDSTHGLAGCSYEMTTLLVIDEFGEGFPCAFFISNRINQAIIEVFLQNIKKRTGVIATKIFMSDTAQHFYNAWKSTMGDCDHQLFCAWHVMRDWHKEISNLNAEKRKIVSNMMRMLLTETDVNSFQRMLNSTLEKLFNDAEMLPFGEYFKEYCVDSCEKWAYCFRLNAGINSNVSLEKLHGTFQHIFLKGTAAKRMDKTINAMMQMVNNKLFNKLIAVEKGKLTREIRELRKRHKIARELSFENIVPHRNPEVKSWSVFSSVAKSDDYVVSLTNDRCNCPVRCHHCDACYHKFACTCIIYSVRGIMCQHVHLVCLFLSEKKVDESKSQIDSDLPSFVDIEEKKEDSHQLVVLFTEPNLDVFTDDKKSLMEMFRDAVERCSTEAEIDVVKETLQTMKVKLASVQEEPQKIARKVRIIRKKLS